MFGLTKFHSVTMACAIAISFSTMAGLGSRYCEAQDEQFSFSLKNNSTITAGTDFESFDWTTVQRDGSMAPGEIRLDSIRQISFTETPNSENISKVRKLVFMVQSKVWSERETAEKELSDPRVGGSFTNVIREGLKRATESNNAEAKYRFERILNELGTRNSSRSLTAKFDKVTLKNGSVLEGDAGNFEIKVNFGGREMVLNRKNLLRIGKPTPPTAIARRKAAPIQTQVFHKPDSFYKPDQINADFDFDDSGQTHAVNQNARTQFSNKGLILEAENSHANGMLARMGHKPFVGAVTYGFKVKPFPDIQSICVFAGPKGGTKYKGIMSVGFCVPGQPGIPASVTEFGFYIKRVDKARDFIMEAFGTDGHLLACVESTDQNCSFMGIKTNEPIARVRVLSNPNLYRLDRVVDDDYAIDNICISQPIPIAVPAADISIDLGFLRMKNGNVFWFDSIRFDRDGKVQVGPKDAPPIELAMDQIHSIRFKREKKKPSDDSNQWRALLNDGSILDITAGRSFRVKGLDVEAKLESIQAITVKENQFRAPLEKDFDSFEQVLVFPTCRIPLGDPIDMTDAGFSWNREAEKLLQPVNTITPDESEEEIVPEDPTPQHFTVNYKESGASDVPTVWFNPPKSRAANTGIVRLQDGQQLVIGDGSFSIDEFSDSGIKLTQGDQQLEIEWAKVASFELPNQ